MYDLFERNNRLIIRENFLNIVDNFTKTIFIENNLIRGYIFCIFHIFVVSVPFLTILCSNKIKYVLFSQFILLLILIQHFYFDGCWMIRLERKIWNTKDWYGLWTYLFNFIEYIGFKLNRNSRDIIFYIVYSFILTIGFYRIYSFKNSI